LPTADTQRHTSTRNSPPRRVLAQRCVVEDMDRPGAADGSGYRWAAASVDEFVGPV